MKIERVLLQSYRNYDRAEVILSDGVNVFSGANAQGKTNFVEAVILSCVGRSPRTPRDKELVRWECPAAYIRVDAQKKHAKMRIETEISRTENKRISINGLPIRRIGDLMANLNCVFFSPDELKIVKAGPADRRRFLDMAISQMSKTYFYELSRYNRVLNQRNKLLKSGRATVDTLSIWDVQLANSGGKIVRQRKEFVKRIKEYASACHAELTDGIEHLEIEYEGTAGETEQEIGDKLLHDFQNCLERDLRFGVTSTGLHKDDLAIKVNAVDMRAFGSQGQQRTVALSLKLAELEIFKSITGESPVLILDDVLSELDAARQSKLLGKLSGVQTLITCTDLASPVTEASFYKVENGRIEKTEA